MRPIYHRLAHRVRSHVFLCRLVYYVEWQMRERLTPLLFEEEDWLELVEPNSVIVPNKSQTPAKRKASTKRTSENFPVQSFRTLLTNLTTITKNRVQPKLGSSVLIVLIFQENAKEVMPVFQNLLNFSNQNHTFLIALI